MERINSIIDGTVSKVQIGTRFGFAPDILQDLILAGLVEEDTDGE